MADSNLEYWRKREQAQLEANLREEQTYAARLDAQFALLERSIDQLIADFYQRYAAAEGISLADAQQRVAKADIEALAEKAKRYVELASQDRQSGTNQAAEYLSKMANDEMRLYNAMMRINRLELLKAEIGMEVDQTYVQMGGTMDAALTKRTDDELRRQAGILGETVFHNEKDVAAIVNGSFHNATWSQRIWNDGTVLKSNLNVLLTQGLIAGDNPRELARRLRRTFDVSRADAERLMRTELARVQTDAQKMSLERNGYERFMFISTEDSKTCQECNHIEEECIEQDGFLVSEMEPGVNAPPMHPNCRCSTAAHVSQADFEREMMERFGVDMRDDLMSRRTDLGEWPPPGKAINKEQLEELINYGKKRGIDVLSFDNYDGDIELIKSFMDGIVSVANDYPEILNRKRNLQLRCSYTLKAADYAETTNNCINLNGNAFRNREALRQDYLNQQKNTPFFVKGTSYENIVHHEVGHLIVQTYGLSPKEITAGLDIAKVSEYASWSPREAIAESFSAFYAMADNEVALQIKGRCDIIIKERRVQNDSR